MDPTCKEGGASEASGEGGPASEASLSPEASQVVAEGDGLRVFIKSKTVFFFDKKWSFGTVCIMYLRPHHSSKIPYMENDFVHFVTHFSSFSTVLSQKRFKSKIQMQK